MNWKCSVKYIYLLSVHPSVVAEEGEDTPLKSSPLEISTNDG